jgi:hypothetical protein
MCKLNRKDLFFRKQELINFKIRKNPYPFFKFLIINNCFGNSMAVTSTQSMAFMGIHDIHSTVRRHANDVTSERIPSQTSNQATKVAITPAYLS